MAGLCEGGNEPPGSLKARGSECLALSWLTGRALRLAELQSARSHVVFVVWGGAGICSGHYGLPCSRREDGLGMWVELKMRYGSIVGWGRMAHLSANYERKGLELRASEAYQTIRVRMRPGSIRG
ncbi:hypothetical protein ANN_04341 [Periplaneta americana]|uniref:Per a allergen n=1 Tax=Periplaneta americana TaxID=6978 RepID=A0ABQ8T8B7_PERAM|nr:hypothetical protein ANN_04341 [Periplaneta americana]